MAIDLGWGPRILSKLLMPVELQVQLIWPVDLRTVRVRISLCRGSFPMGHGFVDIHHAIFVSLHIHFFFLADGYLLLTGLLYVSFSVHTESVSLESLLDKLLPFLTLSTWKLR